VRRTPPRPLLVQPDLLRVPRSRPLGAASTILPQQRPCARCVEVPFVKLYSLVPKAVRYNNTEYPWLHRFRRAPTRLLSTLTLTRSTQFREPYCLPSRGAQEVPCRSVFAMRWIQSAFVRSFVCVHCPPFRGAQRARSPVGSIDRRLVCQPRIFYSLKCTCPLFALNHGALHESCFCWRLQCMRAIAL